MGVISVRLNDEEEARIREAAALAGKSPGRYLRDVALGRSEQEHSLDQWANWQEVFGRLARLERQALGSQALAALTLFLSKKKATTGDLTGLKLLVSEARAAGLPLAELVHLDHDLAQLLADPEHS